MLFDNEVSKRHIGNEVKYLTIEYLDPFLKAVDGI